MKKNILKFFLFFSSFSLLVYSQQSPIYTQYLYNPLVINPAFSGVSESSSIILMNRSQWTGFIDDDIRTTSIAANHALNNQNNLVGPTT